MRHENDVKRALNAIVIGANSGRFIWDEKDQERISGALHALAWIMGHRSGEPFEHLLENIVENLRIREIPDCSPRIRRRRRGRLLRRMASMKILKRRRRLSAIGRKKR